MANEYQDVASKLQQLQLFCQPFHDGNAADAAAPSPARDEQTDPAAFAAASVSPTADGTIDGVDAAIDEAVATAFAQKRPGRVGDVSIARCDSSTPPSAPRDHALTRCVGADKAERVKVARQRPGLGTTALPTMSLSLCCCLLIVLAKKKERSEEHVGTPHRAAYSDCSASAVATAQDHDETRRIRRRRR
jgi:hypothetical protein